MSATDFHTKIKPVAVIDPAAAKTATTTSAAISVADYQSVAVLVHAGVITDGTHTPKLQECATSGGTYTDVAASNQAGTFAALTSTTTQRVTYLGTLSYIKLVVTVSGATSGGFYTALAIKGQPRVEPAT